MRDIVLVTVECLRRDRASTLAPQLGEVHDCYTAGHYTRPALAGLLSGDTRAAIKSACLSPTVTERLHEAGYSTIGVCHSPQATPDCGFDNGFETFLSEIDSGSRGSDWREWLGQYRPVRRLHRRVSPKAATLEAITHDETAIQQAIDAYEAAAPPRFLWVHLMGTHRPYGWGADKLPSDVSRRTAGATPGRLTASPSQSEAEDVRDHYDTAVERAGQRVRRLVDAIDGDASVIVCGDHGEELGEAGYWYHGPYRRRTADSLTVVPMWTRHVSVGGDMVRHIDIPASLCRVAGLAHDSNAFLGGASHAITVAPWANKFNAVYRTRDTTMRFENATPEALESVSVDSATKRQLAALGYN